MHSTKEWYDIFYQDDNSFGYKAWLYKPYLKSLLAKADLKAGSTVLDVGCGRGFFSGIMRDCGMRVTGVDISEIGVQAARKRYGNTNIRFIAVDINSMPAREVFDGVFVRSFSLYNVENFSRDHQVTDRLMEYVKPGGAFIFAYNTNLKFPNCNGAWRYHTLTQAREHCASYSNAECFFTLKIEALVLGRLAFNRLVSVVNSRFSTMLGIGGDLVCIVRKSVESYE